MKRWLMLGVMALLATAVAVWAQQTPPAQPTQSTAATTAGQVSKPKTHRALRHGVVGKVTAISDTSLTIERTVGGKTETMEFSLTKPLSGIAVGDEVRVSYKTEDGKNVVVSVKKVGVKKAATPSKQ